MKRTGSVWLKATVIAAITAAIVSACVTWKWRMVPGGDYSGRMIADSLLNRADVSGGSFRHARLDGVSALRVNAQGADFSSAHIYGGMFCVSALGKCNFSNASFLYTTFFCCDLRGANFSGATLDFVTFIDCDLRDANLAYKSRRTFIIHDAATRFPAGYPHSSSSHEVDMDALDSVFDNWAGARLR